MMELGKTMGQIQPHNLEAEQAVLGCMLLDRAACDKVIEILKSEDFYRSTHSMLFDLILSMVEQDQPVDLLTVCNELEEKERLESVGGREYLVTLLDAVPTSANAEYYARIVEEKSILRQLIRAGAEIQGFGYSEAQDVEGLVDQAQQMLFKVGQRRIGDYFSPLVGIVNEVWEKMEAIYQDKGLTTGVPTGFERIDLMTSGLQPGDLVIVAARPSMGKTALALNFCVNAAIAVKKPVAIFSLEMSKEQLVQRMICSLAKVDAHRLRTGYLREGDWDRMAQASQLLWQAPIFIDDASDCTAMAMRAKCRRLKAEQGLSLVMVDYMQLMRWHRNVENRNQEISEIARSLKGLARDLKVPVIALSQLSRQTERREDRKPMLSDLRESGSIEAEADVVMMIYRPSYYETSEVRPEAPNMEDSSGFEQADDEQGQVAHIILAKQRNGPVGTVKLSFIPKYASFENLVEGIEEPD